MKKKIEMVILKDNKLKITVPGIEVNNPFVFHVDIDENIKKGLIESKMFPYKTHGENSGLYQSEFIEAPIN